MAVRAAELEVIVTADASQASEEINATNDALGRIGQFAVGEKLIQWGQDALGFAKNFIVAGADFAQEMNFVDKLTGDSGQYFQALQDKALQMGEKTIFSAQEVAKGMEQLAREGFAPLDIIGTNSMNSLIEGSANMAAALNINLDDAANMLGMTERVFADQNIKATDATNILTEAVLRSGKSADDFQTAWQYVGISANQLHIPMEQAAAAVGLLESQGLSASKVGTGLQQFLNGLTTEGSKAQKTMADLGISAVDENGNFRGLLPVLGDLHDAYVKMNDEQKTTFATALSGGQKASAAVKQLLQDGPQGILEFIGKMEKLGGAASIMASLVDTTAGSFHILSSSIFTAEKVMGDAVDGYIKPLVDAAAALVNAFIAAPPAIHLVAAALVILGGIALTLAGGLLIALAIGIGNIAAAAAIGIAAVAGIAAVFGLLAAAAVLVKPKIDEFRQTFQTATMLGMNPFNAALTALRFTIPQLAPLFDFIRAKGDEMRVTFQTATMLGMNPFEAALEALRFAFPSLAPMFDDFRKAGDRLTAAYGQDGLRGVLLALPGAIKLVADGLVQAGILLAPVAAHVAKWVVSEIATGAENLAGTITSFVHDHYNGTVAAIKEAGADIVHWVVSTTEDLYGTISKFVKDHYNGTVAAVERAGANVLHWIVTAAEDLYGAITKFVKDHYNGTVAPIETAGANVKQWVVTESTSLKTTVEHFIKDHVAQIDVSGIASTLDSKLASAIQSVNWQHLGEQVGNAVGAALKVAAVIGFALAKGVWSSKAGEALVEAGGQFIVGFLKGIDNQTKALGDKINAVIADSSRPFVNARNWLVNAGRDLVAGLITGATNEFHALTDYMQGISNAVTNAFNNAGNWLLLAGTRVIVGFINGMTAVYNTIATYLRGVQNAVTSVFSSAGNWLLSAGQAVINGLTSGIGEGFGAMEAIVKSIPTAIRNNVVGAIGWLYQAGVDVIQGFINGLASKAQEAADRANPANYLPGGKYGPFGGGTPANGPGANASGSGPKLPPGTQPIPVPPGGVFGGLPGQFAGMFGGGPAPYSAYSPLGSAGRNDLIGGFVPGVGAAPSLGNIQATGLMSSDQQGAAAEFQQMTAKVNGQAQALTGQLGAAGTAAGQAWARGLGAGLQTGLAAVTSVITAVSTIATGATGRLAGAGTAAGQGWARALGAGLQTGLTAVAAVTNAINTIVSALTGRLIADGTTSGQGWARGLGTGLQTALTAVVAVTNAIAAIMTAWGTRTVQVGQQTGQQFAVAWGQGLQLALTATTAVTTAMSTIVTTAFNAMRTTVQTQATAMATAATSAFTTMRANVTSAANAMNSGVSSAFNAMRSSGSAAVSGLASSVAGSFNAMRGQAISAAQSMMSGVVGAINAGAGAAAGAAFNAGASIGAGLANGMYSELGAVQAAAAALAGAAAAAAAASLGVASPSKVFHRIGLFVGEGFAAGIRESMANAANVVRASTLGVVQATEGAVNQALARPGATVAAGRGGGTVVYVTNNNTVRVDDLPDVIRAAQFVRDSDSVRQLIMGTT